MTDVLLEEQVFGVQEPRFIHTPVHSVRNAAKAAAALCAAMSMPLDPWQVVALEAMLGIAEDGTWAAQEYGLICARQNGKSAILEARELAGLFLFGETRIIHSAHNANTAKEAFDRMRGLIERTPWLLSEVKQILGSPGRQAIVLKSGAKLTYSTRTKGGARGFSAPVVIFDEAQELTGEQLAAIVPVTSSFKNRQLIFTGTVLAGASVFRGIVERGRTGISADLGYTEWSAPEGVPSEDIDGIRQANPAIGYRPGLTVDYFLSDLQRWRAAGEEDRYREERLSIWPDPSAVGKLIPVESWTRCRVTWKPGPGQILDYVGIASTVDLAWSSVGVAFSHEGKTYLHIAAHRPGTEWVIPYVMGLTERRKPRAVALDKGGPAWKALANGLYAVLPKGVMIETSTPDMQSATATFIEAVKGEQVEHLGQPELDAAVVGVREKIVGDSRMYDRRKSQGVISPVEAVTLAAWGLLKTKGRPSKYERDDLLILG